MKDIFDLEEFSSYREDNRREVKKANDGLQFSRQKAHDFSQWDESRFLFVLDRFVADYYGSRGIVIKKEPQKLTLENPGYIRTGKFQMCRGGESDPRNKSLMKMFNLINIGERAGSGVPNIIMTWNDEGLKEPIIEERFGPDRTILVLEFKKKTSEEKQTTIS